MVKHHISLKDLAEKLGVSISTVSRGLKNHPDISHDVCEKIQKLAKELKYSPNPLAMGLLKQQTNMIGVLVPDIVTHFYSSIISGIESIAKEKGYFILIASSNESFLKETESVENLLKARVEGIIVCISEETTDFRHFQKLIDNEMPLVFFDRIGETVTAPSVTVDGEDAARLVIKHLYDNGCRRIAYISGPEHLNISKNRKAGYLKGLNECGLPFNQDLLVESKLNSVSAVIATQRLLNLSKIPDAIFGVNDTIVFAAMKEIKKRGLKIPEDIALVGFTDEFHSTVVDPTLTSVTHPTYRMGQESAKLFFKCINSKIPVKDQIVLQTELVIRESSRKLK